MTLWEGTVAFGAALLAGGINSVAGGGTMLTYPVLLWIRHDAILANATSTVALVPGSFAGILGYRGELKGSRRWLIMLGIPSLIGGGVGAALLLKTPEKMFKDLVPFLILGATLLRAAQEPISRWLGHAPNREPSRAWWAGAIAFQFLVAVYGGYFGAGIGILMLAALGLLGLTDIHRMNGLKTIFAVLINVIAAVCFIFAAKVNWPDALVMAVGATIGGYGGARLAQRVERKFVNYAIIVIGLAMAVALFFQK